MHAEILGLWLRHPCGPSVKYRGPGQNAQSTIVVQRRAAKFTDLEIEFDCRIEKYGAWKYKDTLKWHHMINKERDRIGTAYMYLSY